MGDENPTWEIKVKTTKPERRTEPKPEYIYFWDRIFGALAALVLLIGLIGYGVYAWLTPSRPPAGAAVEEVEGPEKLAAKAVPKTDGNVQEAEPSPSVPPSGIAAANKERQADSTTTPSESLRSESASGQLPFLRGPAIERASEQTATEAAATVALPRFAEAEESPEENAGPAPLPPSIADAPPEHKLVAETITGSTALPDPPNTETANPAPALPPAPEEIAEAASTPTPVSESGEEERSTEREQMGEAAAMAATPEEDTNRGLFRSQNIAIFSPAVKRFVLARSVRDKEPEGSLDDIVLNAEGIAPVCSFSEVIGMAGEVLEYRWLYDTKQVLRIRVPVGAQRWRSHAQKDIYKGMKGSWRVELRDSAGQLLASADFMS